MTETSGRRFVSTSTARRVGICSLVVALLSLFVAGTPAVAAPGPYPVSYDFLLNAFQYGSLPSSPGENIWTCKPNAAHPEPVVLVHGTGGAAASNWGTYSALLADDGYCVFALTYGMPASFSALGLPFGGLNSIESSAAQLQTFVSQVLAATGASKVDIVGHSQGTLMPDYYVKFLGGAQYVDKYVSLAPLWHGTFGDPFNSTSNPSQYSFPMCAACTEMTAGSPFIDEIQSSSGAAVAGVTYTNIMTDHDELVVPYTSGFEAGMTNIVLQDDCSQDLTDHVEIASDPVAAAYVLNALDPAHPQPIPCEPVLPGVGPPPLGS